MRASPSANPVGETPEIKRAPCRIPRWSSAGTPAATDIVHTCSARSSPVWRRRRRPPRPRRPAARSPPRPPKVRALQCRTACMGVTRRPHRLARARAGQGAQARRLRRLPGRPGGADDVSVAPLRAQKTYVDARVPRTAVSGPVAARLRATAPSPRPDRRAADDRPDAVAPADDLRRPRDRRRGPGQPRLLRRRAQGPGLLHRARLAAACNVAVELVRLSDGVAITRWEPGASPPETPQTITWDGTAGGKVQRDGRYAFRVFATVAVRRHRLLRPGARARRARRAPSRAPSSSSATSSRSAAPHTMGTGAAAFGGGRGHQGQDIFAKCGTPLVAARGGRREVQAVPLGAPATTSSSTATTRATTTRTCTCARPRSSTRATTSTPASRSASSATPAAPTAATCTSRSGRRRAGTAAAHPIDPAAVAGGLGQDFVGRRRPRHRRRTSTAALGQGRGAAAAPRPSLDAQLSRPSDPRRRDQASRAASSRSTIAAAASNSGTGSMPTLRAASITRADDLGAEARGVAAGAGHREHDERAADRGGLELALRPLGRLARRAPRASLDCLGRYSHSIVPGGLDVMSSTTRLTSRISLIMREAIRSSRS